MATYEIFRGIQNQPQFWRFEGIFLVGLFVIIIISMILMIITTSWTIKVIIIITGIISILFLRHCSIKYGIRGIKRFIGNFHQPKIIISTGPRFYFSIKGENDLQSTKKN